MSNAVILADAFHLIALYNNNVHHLGFLWQPLNGSVAGQTGTIGLVLAPYLGHTHSGSARRGSAR